MLGSLYTYIGAFRERKREIEEEEEDLGKPLKLGEEGPILENSISLVSLFPLQVYKPSNHLKVYIFGESMEFTLVCEEWFKYPWIYIHICSIYVYIYHYP